MRTFSHLLVLSILAVTAFGLPSIPNNWFAPNYAGSLVFNGQTINLKGTIVWQMDDQFNRSAYVSVDGFSSTFMDWDGKTYGSPAVYYYDVGFHCDHWCPLTPSDMCGEAEGLCDYDMLTSSVFANHTIIDGQAVDTWVWNDTAIFGSASNALYFLSATSTPFYRTNYAHLVNMPETIIQTYGGFRGGLPDNNNWFNVPDAQYCPMGEDGQCDDVKGFRNFMFNLNRQQKLAN